MITKHYHEHLVVPAYPSSREKQTANGYIPTVRKREYPKKPIGPPAVVNLGNRDDEKIVIYDRFAKIKTI